MLYRPISRSLAATLAGVKAASNRSAHPWLLPVAPAWRTLSEDNLRDHHMDNYLNRLSTKTKGAVEVAYNQREQFVAKKP